MTYAPKHDYGAWMTSIDLPMNARSALEAELRARQPRSSFRVLADYVGRHRAPGHCGAYRTREYVRVLDPTSVTGVAYVRHEPRPAVLRTVELPGDSGGFVDLQLTLDCSALAHELRAARAKANDELRTVELPGVLGGDDRLDDPFDV